MSKYNFANSLAIGKSGEYWLQKVLPGVTRLDGRKADFMLGSARLELKSDSYAMSKTPNLFIERWSDIAKAAPGGPWQAQANGCTLFCYTYRADCTAFVFDLECLLAYIEQNLGSFSKRLVHNQGWTTEGLLVPREAVMHTCLFAIHNNSRVRTLPCEKVAENV